MAAQMPACSNSSQAKAYTSAEVVIICFSSYERAIENADSFGKALRSYGIKVTFVTEYDLNLEAGEPYEDADEKVAAWIRNHHAESCAASEGEKLYGLCYFGHGGIGDEPRHLRASSLGDEWGNKFTLSLTQAQQIYRDELSSDAFCFFSCCHGDHDGMSPAHPDVSASGKIMETLAAGKGLVWPSLDWNYFSRRFCLDMMRFREGKSLFERFSDAEQRDACPQCPGFWRRDLGPSDSSIVLPIFPSILFASQEDRMKKERQALEAEEAERAKTDLSIIKAPREKLQPNLNWMDPSALQALEAMKNRKPEPNKDWMGRDALEALTTFSRRHANRH